mmetsp:Transcript_35474/g.70387  ORF Transcript_35474/g.70387 Transcript_35474/m.70387 type:complete len:324 (+) Transcript_35474:477-1448(+)
MDSTSLSPWKQMRMSCTRVVNFSSVAPIPSATIIGAGRWRHFARSEPRTMVIAKYLGSLSPKSCRFITLAASTSHETGSKEATRGSVPRLIERREAPSRLSSGANATKRVCCFFTNAELPRAARLSAAPCLLFLMPLNPRWRLTKSTIHFGTPFSAVKCRSRVTVSFRFCPFAVRPDLKSALTALPRTVMFTSSSQKRGHTLGSIPDTSNGGDSIVRRKRRASKAHSTRCRCWVISPASSRARKHQRYLLDSPFWLSLSPVTIVVSSPTLNRWRRPRAVRSCSPPTKPSSSCSFPLGGCKRSTQRVAREAPGALSMFCLMRGS